MADLSCDVLVIGGGPGGYVCAIRAAQLGLETILVDRDGLGGTCLNVGCIPSKALIHVADEFYRMTQAKSGAVTGISCHGSRIDLGQTQDWKNGIVSRLTGGVGALLKRADVRVFNGEARFLDGKTIEMSGGDETRRITGKSTVIATGSVPLSVPGMATGGKVIGSTEALALREVPKKLVVVGAGYIGLELGTAYAKLGSGVQIVEAGPEILPLYDPVIVAPVKARFKELGVVVHTETRLEQINGAGQAVLDSGKKLPCDYVLMTVGRTANTAGFGLDLLDLDMDGRFIRIDERCETSMRGVYAIGDVVGEPLLAHRAMAQGDMVAEILAGKRRRWDDKVIPAVCFTDPEIVSVGLAPKQAAEQSVDHLEARFPFAANGRAMTLERDDGFIRVVARREDHALIGVQAVGAGVAELSSAFVMAIEMGARLEDVASIVEAHPTLGEGFQEAALKSLGQAIHV